MKKEAKYLQLAALLREEIQSGELAPGQKMSSENELTALYGFSRQTVRHALALLEEEGAAAPMSAITGRPRWRTEPGLP